MKKEHIEMLQQCADTCDNCYTACLNEADVKSMARCIALDRDCADICRMTASALARKSEMRDSLLKACAEICRACADECAKHGMHHCQECAKACRECAHACVEMIR